jgi:Xaa-Pro aminopeptidase
MGRALFAELRARKSPWEIDRLRLAAQVVEEAERECIDAIAPGVSEQELVDRFEEACRARGAIPLGAHIGAGPRSVLPLVSTFRRTVAEHDIVKLDVICSRQHYKADTARTVAVGRADDAARAAFEAVRAGAQAAIDAIRPGAVVGDVFAAAVGAVRRCGFPEFDRHQVGHGIGLEIHEPPALAREDGTILEPGVVVCVEAQL